MSTLNLKQLPTMTIQIYSERLFSYYSEIQQHLSRMNQSQLEGVQEKFAPVLQQELNVLSGALQAIQQEMQQRMKSDLGTELINEEVFQAISEYYKEENAANQAQIHSLKPETNA